MENSIKEMLHVEVGEEIKNRDELIPRCYTLTHSDETGELFLDINSNYRCEGTTEKSDEILAYWDKIDSTYILNVHLDLDGNCNTKDTEERDIIFRTELPLALNAIIYGDRSLYLERKELINAPIIVHFDSKDEEYNKVERWGEVSDYLTKKDRVEAQFNFPPNLGTLTPTIGNVRLRDGLIFTLLDRQIERELRRIFGNRFVFCHNFAEIISIRPLNAPLACKGRYSVGIRVRSGLNVKSPNVVLMELLVAPEGVRVQSIRNPRCD